MLYVKWKIYILTGQKIIAIKICKFEDRIFCPKSDKLLYVHVFNWQDLIRKQVVELPTSKVTKIVMEEDENMKRPEYPKPDTQQWLPFKPKISVRMYIYYYMFSGLWHAVCRIKKYSRKGWSFKSNHSNI